MTVDNFDQIEKLLNFENEGEFYMIQIMQRGKDQNDGRPSSAIRIIKSYFVESIEHLEERREEIKALCEFFNARAVINLNKKNFEQTAFKGLRIITDIICTKEYHSIRSLFESACGQTGACDKNKTWIVDVDTNSEDELLDIIGVLAQCEPIDVDKVVDIIPTPHGKHIITKPFNKKTFSAIYGKPIDIHDGTPTVLYYKDMEE